jgi:hypothetical protein
MRSPMEKSVVAQPSRFDRQVVNGQHQNNNPETRENQNQNQTFLTISLNIFFQKSTRIHWHVAKVTRPSVHFINSFFNILFSQLIYFKKRLFLLVYEMRKIFGRLAI